MSIGLIYRQPELLGWRLDGSEIAGAGSLARRGPRRQRMTRSVGGDVDGRVLGRQADGAGLRPGLARLAQAQVPARQQQHRPRCGCQTKLFEI